MPDTNQVATKSDIHGLKGDIDRLEKSTKKEISNLRNDFKRTEKSLRAEILKVEERVENIEESQKRVETKLDKLQSTLDGFVGRVDDLTAENVVGTNQIHELRKDVDNHEARIKHLESTAQTTQ